MSIFDCPRRHLCLDPETIHSEKWPTVPGARWVNYTRPSETRSVAMTTSSPPRAAPTVARFVFDGPVLPHVTHTVRVAEVFRHEALQAFTRQHGPGLQSVILSGKEADGRPRRTHGHAHFLPTAEGADRQRITHLTVYAEDGFGPEEVAALTALRVVGIRAGGGREIELRVQMVGLGMRKLFQDQVGWLGPAAVWESLTPFVAHRHLKRRGAKKDTPHLVGLDSRAEFAELAVRELIARRQLGILVGVQRLDFLPCRARAAEFERRRARAEDDGYHRPFGAFRLTFSSPIEGPLCLGYGCHYGLGLFGPGSRQPLDPLPTPG
jgi:CRISPR-associated protein Csb2